MKSDLINNGDAKVELSQNIIKDCKINLLTRSN